MSIFLSLASRVKRSIIMVINYASRGASHRQDLDYFSRLGLGKEDGLWLSKEDGLVLVKENKKFS